MSAFNVKAASDSDASFLPLNFWGASEMAAKESIFYDHQHDGLLKAPSVCNSDGTPTNFAKLLMDAEIDNLFGDEDSNAVEKVIQYTLLQKRLEFALHILTT
jgi:hypothetical protein